MQLTRYKETFNIITNSKAFSETGQADNNKINKNIWTPHNLQRVCFDANGVLLVYFTTNNSTQRLVDYKPFKSLIKPEELMSLYQQGKDPFKTAKPMINALFDNIVFSNVEEILLFTGNFNPQITNEYNSELMGTDRFGRDQALIEKSFKRLETLVLVDNPLIPEEYLKLDPTKTILEQLQSVGIPCKLVKFQPEKNELGLLKSVVLDSAEYKPDKQYDPNEQNKNSVDCRLSKHFYDLEQNRKKALSEQQDKYKKEETKKSEEDVIYDAQVENAVKSTLNKLEAFYAPLWGKKYDAIFCETGLKFTVSGRNYNRVKSLVDAMYASWKEVADIERVADAESTSFDINASYSPGFHHEVLNSRELWSKGRDGETAIKTRIAKKYLNLYNKFYFEKPEQLDMLESRLTNGFVVKRWGKNDVLLRFTGIKPEQKEEFERVFSEKLAATYRGGSMAGMIANCEINNMGIGTLTYIINWQEFLDEILFAYKQYTEHGIKPSLTNALLGLKMDGSPLSINLVETGQMLTTILAGSRSGKGTLTMGLLASLFGAGGSIVYLDNKPDIGSMLWDLEREYANQGLKLLSLDVGKEMHEFTGSTPIRTGELNLLPNDAHQATAFRILRLCKLFQLVTLIGKHSSEISAKLGITTDNLFFIVDELTSLNADYTTLELYVKEMSKKYKSIADKQKATDEDKGLAKYYATLENMIIQMNIDLVQGLTKDWGMSGIRVILIGQELGAKWKVAGKGFNTSFAGLLMNSTHKTLAGRIQSNPNTYRFGKSGAKLAEQTGVFTYSQSAPSPIDAAGSQTLGLNITQQQKFQQFRSYFSLVKNDFDFSEFESEGAEQYVINHPKRFTTQLLSNFINKGEDAINRVVNELYDAETSKNRDEISFSGLIKVMQQKAAVSNETLINNMNKGYQILDGIFKLLGLTQYQHLEEYLCDCSPNGVFTLAELKGILGLAGGVAPKKKESKTFEFDDEINYFDGVEQNEVKSQYQEATTQQQQSEQYKQKPNVDKSTNPYSFKKPDANTPYKFNEVLRDVKIDVPDMMGDMCKSDGVFNKLYVVQEVTNYILKEIKNRFGTLNEVMKFMVTSEGIISINDVAIAPQFNEDFIIKLPEEMQDNVRDGYLADIFSMRAIYKFKKLKEIEIEDEAFAKGRVQTELGLKSKSFTTLYDTLHRLQSIIIGGVPYVKGDVVQNYLEPRPRLRDLKNTMSAINNMTVNPDTLMGKVLHSKVCKTLVCALGWTAGLQLAWGIAALMGPFGLLFGTLALAGTIKEFKSSSNNNNNHTTMLHSNKPQNTRNQTAKRINGGNPYYKNNRTNR